MTDQLFGSITLHNNSKQNLNRLFVNDLQQSFSQSC